MRIRFLTSTPLNPFQGSGTFTGIHTLTRALRALGVEVELVAPKLRLPVYTATRLLFNEQLRLRRLRPADITVGFDMDGYRVAGREPVPHVASVKGVIADELRFERGLTRATMRIQAACERIHVRRADLVMTTSRYAARRIEDVYGVTTAAIVPELIDLAAWRELFAAHPAEPDPRKFTVLCVCRFYPRKRLDLLLEAAMRLRERIPELEIRIVGGGPKREKLLQISESNRLEKHVLFLGDLTQSELAREYQRCHVFCLPSVQEGFGIVLLEAMAAGKPIVAACAAAIPEVVSHGLLVEPGSAEALAEGLVRLHGKGSLLSALAEAGRSRVSEFDAPRVARQFLQVLSGVKVGAGF